VGPAAASGANVSNIGSRKMASRARSDGGTVSRIEHQWRRSNIARLAGSDIAAAAVVIWLRQRRGMKEQRRDRLAAI
jgi:hypothetical protein